MEAEVEIENQLIYKNYIITFNIEHLMPTQITFCTYRTTKKERKLDKCH